MPAVSKAQGRYMCGICHGDITPPKSLSKMQACEFCTSTKNKPEHVAPPRRKRG